MDEEQEDIVTRIQMNNLSNDIWILIPPRYWGVKGLSAAIKKAIDMTTAPEDPKRELGRH